MSIASGYQQYMRKYRVLVIPKTGRTGLDVSALRCSFYVDKSVSETPNYSQIAIYNLSRDTISSIKAGDTVILEAGYENGNYGMIFTGQIVQPHIVREGGTDLVLTLICQDGDAFLNSSFTATTISAGSTHSDVVAVCTKKSGTPMQTGMLTESLAAKVLPRGKTLFGRSAKYLSNVAAAAQSQFYIEDGVVNIVAASDYSANKAVELNPMTGLIGTPSQTDDGVSAQCLINPSIKLNTLVYINASLVAAKQASSSSETAVAGVNTDGVYRIVKLVYEGDTRGDTWYCTFEAITQSGAKPDGLVGDATNPWR